MIAHKGLPARTDSNRTDAAKAAAQGRRIARSAKRPQPLNLSRLAAELGAEVR